MSCKDGRAIGRMDIGFQRGVIFWPDPCRLGLPDILTVAHITHVYIHMLYIYIYKCTHFFVHS